MFDQDSNLDSAEMLQSLELGEALGALVALPVHAQHLLD